MNSDGRSSGRRAGRTAFLYLALGAMACRLSGAPAPASDYQRDLTNVNHRLAVLAKEETDTREIHAAMLAEKAMLTEQSSDLTQARQAIANVLARAAPAPAFVALHAKILLQLHQTSAVQKDVDWLETHAPLYAELAGLRTDLLIEAGKFGAAQTLCETALRRRREWPMLARLAQVNTLLGHFKEADALYVEAQDSLTAKQMKVFAWLEVQRGRAAGTRGAWADAESHYGRAEQAYSGLWRVAACKAEAASAQGKYSEGVSLYEALVERKERPELFQALGDLYRFSGNAVQAKIWHQRALAGYRASAERDEVLYYHHLADFYADVRGEGEAAVNWARLDFKLRPGPRTRQTLAWALYRAGAMGEALTEITDVLSSGLQDAHLFEQAARINSAVGKADEAKRLLRKAASLNPNYKGFHVHF